MSATGTESTLAGVTINVLPPIAERIERVNATIRYLRSRTKTIGITRGVRALDVRARVRTDSALSTLREYWENEHEVVFTDDQRGGLYSGTYVIGDLNLEDASQASVFATISFTLFSKGAVSIDGIASDEVGAEMVGG